MSSYEVDKDKLIKFFEMDQEDGKFLQISIMQYGNAPSKLQITRRFSKKDGTVGYGKMGRLSKEEVQWFSEQLEEIMKYLD